MITGAAAKTLPFAGPTAAVMKFKAPFHRFLWAGGVVLGDVISAFLSFLGEWPGLSCHIQNTCSRRQPAGCPPDPLCYFSLKPLASKSTLVLPLHPHRIHSNWDTPPALHPPLTFCFPGHHISLDSKPGSRPFITSAFSVSLFIN